MVPARVGPEARRAPAAGLGFLGLDAVENFLLPLGCGLPLLVNQVLQKPLLPRRQTNSIFKKALGLLPCRIVCHRHSAAKGSGSACGAPPPTAAAATGTDGAHVGAAAGAGAAGAA